MKIIVRTEEEKQKLLEQSEYLHNNFDWRYNRFMRFILRNNQAFCNDAELGGTLMHIYLYPDMIEVQPDYIPEDYKERK